MKRIVKKKIKVVANKDPDQFQDEVNRLIDDLAHLKPSVDYNINTDTYKALFQYELVEEVPETAQEECEEQGLRLTCNDCPRFEPMLNNDGTVKQTAKRGSCFRQPLTRKDSTACEWFCSQLLGGKITIRKGE